MKFLCSTWKCSNTLGLPECEKLKLKSVNCITVDASWKKGQISEQSRQHKSCINEDLKITPLTVQNKYKVDYFIAGPRKEVDIAASAMIIWEMHNNYNEIFS